jgi:hypothetical protein
MDHELKHGAVARVKSSGKLVLVFYIYRESAYCRWIDRNKLESGVFPLSALEAVPTSGKTPQKTPRFIN